MLCRISIAVWTKHDTHASLAAGIEDQTMTCWLTAFRSYGLYQKICPHGAFLLGGVNHKDHARKENTTTTFENVAFAFKCSVVSFSGFALAFAYEPKHLHLNNNLHLIKKTCSFAFD